jgi:hypothetical protein
MSQVPPLHSSNAIASDNFLDTMTGCIQADLLDWHDGYSLPTTLAKSCAFIT